jgi:hypothetical protein
MRRISLSNKLGLRGGAESESPQQGPYRNIAEKAPELAAFSFEVGDRPPFTSSAIGSLSTGS